MTPQRNPTLLPAIIVAALGLLAGPAALGSESAHDIIPENWISYNGSAPDAAPGTKLLILPSQPASGEPVHYPAPGFLARGSRFKSECFRFRTSQGGTGQIDVTRADAKTLAVTISATAPTQKQLRSLEWAEFQKVQGKFEQFLFEKTACKCICIFTSRPPRQRFGEKYEQQLREFWLECLKGSSYKAFAAGEGKQIFKTFPRSEPTPDRVGDSGGAMVANTAEAGATPAAVDAEPPATEAIGKMRVIPLFPAMRLSIHWGTTAVYPGGDSPSTYSRQSVGGTTVVPIQLRDGAVVLGLGSPWTMATVRPNQSVLPPTSAKPIPLPFGQKLPKGDAANLATVFNEFDLRQESAALFRRIDAEADRKLHLFLLIPEEYTKADFSKKTSGDLESAQLTNDGRSATDVSSTPKAESFARRFFVWQDNASKPEAVAPDFGAINQWAHPALTFANQSWIEPELAISLNGAPAEWVSVGLTLGDVVRAQARWLFSHVPGFAPNTPMFTLFRDKKAIGDSNAGSSGGYQLRFWALPPEFLDSTEVHPGDALFYKP